MVNMEIVEGLKEAMARGESLKQAMFSFYNAGYGKQEIEDSARYLLQIMQAERQKILAQRQAQTALQKPLNKAEQPTQKLQLQIPQQPIQKLITTQPVPQPPQQQIQKPQQQIQKLITTQPSQQITPQFQQQIPQQTTQKVSDYNQSVKKTKITIILLIFILIVLFGALVAMFLFRDKVIELFNNFF